MHAPVVARLVTPTVIALQLGGLVTLLLWVMHGWVLGLCALLVSLVAVARAVQTGFVLDHHGLRVRAFLPGRDRVIPWSALRSVDIDEVVVGTESRSRKRRVRFITDPHDTVQIIGCGHATLDAVLERARGRGVAVHDGRPRRSGGG